MISDGRQTPTAAHSYDESGSLKKRGLQLLGWVGRHPLVILLLPSIWLFARYLPFWKGPDVLCELALPFFDGNILLVPPIYCLIARVPFWLVDTLLSGTAPSIFSGQHPSLAAVYTLILCQHLGLWLALWYFVRAVPCSDFGRGISVLLLASVASFYTFAHTAGAEASTAPTWFFLFGTGIRILSGRSTWRTWLIHFLALLFCIGSRHVSGLILGWLPFTAIVLGLSRFKYATSSPHFPYFRAVAIPALLISILTLGVEESVTVYLCTRFDVVRRQMVGRTLCDRVGTFLDSLSPIEKGRLSMRVASLTNDPDVKVAISSLATVGNYYNGTHAVIAGDLQRYHLEGQALQVEVDRVALEAALCFYRTFDRRFLGLMLKDFVKGFYPTSDQSIAITGPKSTFFSLGPIQRDGHDWDGMRSLIIFKPAVAEQTFDRALHDNFIRHWRFIPIGAWCSIFIIVGCIRLHRRQLPCDLAIIALCIFGIGFLVYFVTCFINFSQPRYVLPLLVSTIAAGSILTVATTRTD